MEARKTEVYDKEERLYLSLVYYRLQKDLEIMDDKIIKNSPKKVLVKVLLIHY